MSQGSSLIDSPAFAPSFSFPVISRDLSISLLFTGFRLIASCGFYFLIRLHSVEINCPAGFFCPCLSFLIKFVNNFSDVFCLPRSVIINFKSFSMWILLICWFSRMFCIRFVFLSFWFFLSVFSFLPLPSFSLFFFLCPTPLLNLLHPDLALLLSLIIHFFVITPFELSLDWPVRLILSHLASALLPAGFSSSSLPSFPVACSCSILSS